MTEPLPPLADPLAYPIASALRDCLRVELLRSLIGPVCCAMVRFGPTSPIMEGCDCTCDGGTGTAWVRVAAVTAAPVTGRGTTSAAGVNVSNCNGPWIVTFDLGVSRCYTLTPRGEPLPCAEEDALALRLLSDMHAVRRAVRCCTELADRPTEWVAWTPARSGGCVGGWASIRAMLP